MEKNAKRSQLQNLVTLVIGLFLIALLFVSCPDNGNSPEEEIPGGPHVLHWTFQEEIPGWVVFDSTRTPDYPAGTTMNIDAVLPDGMTLTASQRTTRWVPAHTAPADGFTDGYIQPNGATAAGKYSLKIENAAGPFTITVNYTARENQKSVPVLFINEDEVKRGNEANGEFDPLSVTYEYTDSDTVTVQLGNVNGGIRIFDVILTSQSSSGNQVLVNNITINEGNFSIVEDGTQQLSVSILPETAGNKRVNWSSGKPDVATVSSAGLVTAVAEGTAVITASARDGSGKSGSITVTVESSWNGDPNNPWALDPLLQELRAFPGAEGYGQNVTGGRKGKVVKVTTLEDAAANPPTGSLRWALQQYPGEPITVVFSVSGLIELKAELRVRRDNFTLAGQTAPGGGICIMGDKVNLGGSNNFIIRHLRFRVGTMNGDPNGKGSIGIENASNFIVDHCTFGWSGEENTTIYDNKRSTVQWCIIHEGLYQSGHGKGERGYGTQWGGESATYHHNLLAHNNSRSPRFNGARANDKDVLIDFVNNVNYNWGKQGACYGGEIETNSHRVNFVNNYYKPGPAFPGTSSSYFIDVYYASSQGAKTALWYMSGNYMEGSANTGKITDNYSGLNIGRYPAGTTIDKLKSASPFEVPYPVTAETAQNAFNSVLAGAGAFPRDTVDARIVQEVRTGTASGSGTFGPQKGIIDSPDAVGGYPAYNNLPAPVDSDGDGIPDEWETANGLNPENPSDGALKNLSRAYTNLEVYLYDLTRIK
ncbi:MAG: Ig-like domain-containing protein [Spirochaetaceae bacterium]|nr:Ig-like domain-containing protein [Spirochaetaceae bacterium]